MSSFSDLHTLANRTIVITGGYGMIGREMVKGALAAGANVAVIEPAPSEEKTKAVFGDVATSGNLMVVRADVTDRATLESALAQIMSRFDAPRC